MDNGCISMSLVDMGWRVGVGWIMEVLVFHWWVWDGGLVEGG